MAVQTLTEDRDLDLFFADMNGDGLVDQVRIHSKEREVVCDGQDYIPLGHCSFDRDMELLTSTIERIIGGKLKVKIENLRASK